MKAGGRGDKQRSPFSLCLSLSPSGGACNSILKAHRANTATTAATAAAVLVENGGVRGCGRGREEKSGSI